MRRSLLPFLLLTACSGSSGGETGLPSGGNNPPPASSYILQLESDAWALVNDERQAQAHPPLAHDVLLRQVARAHSQDMVDRGYFAHVNPSGLDPFDRMSAEGVTYLAAAENIAWNHGYSDPADVAVDGWMNSSGHRANILNGTYTRTGMGVAEDPSGALYFTQVFILPTGSLMLESGTTSLDPGVETLLMGTSSYALEGSEVRQPDRPAPTR